MSSATSNVKYTASRAADSKPLEYVARGGFVGYGIIHLLFAWIAFQVAFRGSGQESDQSGALQTLAGNGLGKVLLVLIAIGMVGPARSSRCRRRRCRARSAPAATRPTHAPPAS